MEREQSLKFMHDLLRALIARKGSDLFITAGFPPAMKVDSKVTPVSQQSLSPIHTQELARGIMTDKQAAEFEATNECNFAISPTGIGRFRVNAFVQQGRVGLVLRTITTTIPKFDDLGLPHVLKDVAMTKRGLVIFVGGTGSGKSTSLAAMIGHRNENSYGHIITIEDPVEYVHEHRNGIVSQRLIPKRGTKGRVAAIEIMLNSPLMSDLIFKGQVHEMKELMGRSRELGMQTFDQALFDLFEADMISYEDALRNADSVNDLRLKIKLESKNAKNRDLGSGLEHLEIVK